MYKSSHLEEFIIRNKDNPLQTRFAFKKEHSILRLISMIEPTFIDEVVLDDGWIVAMKEELN